jgi:sortase A
MRHLIAGVLSSLLIVAGLVLVGFGAYIYYSSRQAQSEAAREWVADSDSEEPVPHNLPLQPTRYFDPYRPGETVAKLQLPHLATPLYVVEGADQKELRKGPGHLPGTALPGVDGNCVIAGHRDTHFRALEGIRKGDEVELETRYGKFRYEVQSMEVVSPTNVSSLSPTTHGVLHLITCYPFQYVGHAPKRIVIEAALQRDK